MVQSLWKMVWQSPAKLNIFFPYDSATYSLVFTLPKAENLSKQKPCTQMFIVTLFVVDKNRRQKCLSGGEWTNQLWYILSIDYYKVLKRNELWIYKKIWNNLKYTNERSQFEELHIGWFQLHDILEKAELRKRLRNQSLPKANGRTRWLSRIQRRAPTVMVDTCHYTLLQT